jgi:hypothetical protein
MKDLDLEIEFHTDTKAPIITDYKIVNHIEEGVTPTALFNVSGHDDDEIRSAYLILKRESHSRQSIELTESDHNSYIKELSFSDLEIDNYTVWYGIQDSASNFITTPTFNLEVNSSLPYDLTFTTDAGNPDIDGDFALLWSDAKNTDNYTLYQSGSPITTINSSVTILGEGMTQTIKYVSDLENGFYYYKLMAINEVGHKNATLTVLVDNKPKEFTLTSNAEEPDLDGKIELAWTLSQYANNYSIYKSEIEITDISDAILVESGIESNNYSLTLENGDYYFIVIAYNDRGQEQSNQISVDIELEEEQEPEERDEGTLIWILVIVGISGGLGIGGYLYYINKEETIR